MSTLLFLSKYFRNVLIYDDIGEKFERVVWRWKIWVLVRAKLSEIWAINLWLRLLLLVVPGHNGIANKNFI